MRGRPPVAELLKRLACQGHQIGVCVVNLAELYADLRSEERAPAQRLIEGLEFYTTNQETARAVGRYRYDYARQGRTLAIADTIVEATAVAEGATLITANIRDFPAEDLELLEQP